VISHNRKGSGHEEEGTIWLLDLLAETIADQLRNEMVRFGALNTNPESRRVDPQDQEAWSAEKLSKHVSHWNIPEAAYLPIWISKWKIQTG
jgi:hypothetical protein